MPLPAAPAATAAKSIAATVVLSFLATLLLFGGLLDGLCTVHWAIRAQQGDASSFSSGARDQFLRSRIRLTCPASRGRLPDKGRVAAKAVEPT